MTDKKQELYMIETYEEFLEAMKQNDLRKEAQLINAMFKDMADNHGQKLGIFGDRINQFWTKYQTDGEGTL